MKNRSRKMGGNSSADRPLATGENFQRLRDRIDREIATFHLHLENWVVVLFKQIPREPEPKAVQALNHWIDHYLPQRTRRNLATLFR